MKKITIILCIMAMSTMVACGNNNSKKSNNNGEPAAQAVQQDKGSSPESIARTKWFYEDEHVIYRLTVNTEGGASLYFTKCNDDGDLLDSGNLFGVYTYKNGKGSIALEDNGKPVDTATFSVNGKKMEFTFKGKTVKMNQKSVD